MSDGVAEVVAVGGVAFEIEPVAPPIGTDGRVDGTFQSVIIIVNTAIGIVAKIRKLAGYPVSTLNDSRMWAGMPDHSITSSTDLKLLSSEAVGCKLSAMAELDRWKRANLGLE